MCTVPDRTANTTAFDGPVVNHWLVPKIAQTANASGICHAGSIDHAGGSKLLQLNAVTPELHPAPPYIQFMIQQIMFVQGLLWGCINK